MTKRDFFLKAMLAQEFRRRAWVISAFSLIRENIDAWKKEPYPYRIVQTPAGHFFIDPDKGGQLTLIEDAVAAEPPLKIKEHLELATGEVENLYKDVVTTYGNVLFNYTVLIYPFGKKVPFQEGRVSAGKLEEHVIGRLADNPKPGDPAPKAIDTVAPLYVSEYLKFCDAMFYLAGFTQLCVPAVTRKTMQAPPGILELRKKLLEENKDRLNDPAVIANVMQQLIKYDKEYLKDDEGANFLISGKSYNVVRSKLFLMHGAEAGMGDGVDVDLIQNSLSEGWDIRKFPAMNNSLRMGSFNRGAETMLGGEAVKWLLRASSNMLVAQEDCGTRLGLELFVDEESIRKLPGFSVVTPDGHEKIPDLEAAGKYMGKKILLRSSMFCKLDKTDYCAVCVGEKLALSPTALSAAIAEYGSIFLLLFMKAMHGKSLEVARMNYRTALS
jgi:hypothetical protein